MEKIDFTITYLDETDPRWQADHRKYSSETDDTLDDVARFRSLDNLRYWFRAVERYAPWVNKIHLITYGHLPDWLNTTHPKLVIVRHKDYLPSEYLPTFNSNVLELNLDKIQGLTEQFVNFNDDFFLNAPVRPDDFFRGGKPVLSVIHMPILPIFPFNVVFFNNTLALNQMKIQKRLFQWKNFSPKNGIFAVLCNLAMLPILAYTRKFLGYHPEHLTQPLTKEGLLQARALASECFERTNKAKFRSEKDINIWLIADMLRATGNFVPHSMRKFGQSVNLGKNVDYARLLRSRLKVVCFNDGASGDVENFEAEKARLNAALQAKFPKKSDFEKGDLL